MSEFDVLSVAADGMSTQRALLDVAARNVAAAQASTPQHPYPRLVAHVAHADAADGAFDPAFGGAAFAGPAFDAVGEEDRDADGGADAPRTWLASVSRSGEAADALTEMISVLDAQRAYEANASVFDVGKKLAERTLDVGRL